HLDDDVLGGGVFEEVVEVLVVPDSEDGLPDGGDDVVEVDRHPRLRVDRKVEREGEPVGVAVQVEAFPRVHPQSVRPFEGEALLQDHFGFFLSRRSSTLTESTMPSRIGVSLRTRTRTAVALVRASRASAIFDASVSIRW